MVNTYSKRPELNPVFFSHGMKKLGALLLPIYGMLVKRGVTPSFVKVF